MRFFTIATILSSLIAFGQTSTTLTSPVNGSNCESSDVLFEWEIVPNSVDYRLEISLDGNWASPLVQIVTDSTEYLRTLNNSTTYFWRVGTRFGLTSSTYSYSNSFSFQTTIAGPSNILPTNGSTCVSLSSATFTWSSLLEANSYQLQVSALPTFGTLEADINNISGNFQQIALSSGNVPHYYRVRANYTKNATSCVSEWSNATSFSTNPNTPDLITPADSLAGLDFQQSFTWSQVLGIDSYNLQVSNSSTFGSLDLIFNSSTLTNNFQSVTFTQGLYNKDYWWRVKTISGACESDWSDIYILTTKLKEPILGLPIDGANCITPENASFSWSNSASSASYDIQIAKDENFNTNEYDQKVENNTANLQLSSPNTLYYWRVRTNNGVNFSDWSTSASFVTSVSIPIPLSPSDDSEDLFIEQTLRFDPVGAYGSLALQVADNPNFSDNSLLYDLSELPTASYTIELPEYNQTYYWRASSTLGECGSDWSETFSFTTYDGDITPVSPENNATNQTINLDFKWKAALFATGYEVHISKNANFNILSRRRLIDGGSTSVFIPDLDPNTKFYWRVRSRNKVGPAPWSAVFTFETGSKRSSTPFLISPIKNQTMVSVNPSLEWTKADNADSYQVQISSNSDFENLIFDISNVSSTLTSLSDLNHFTYYYWRVRGVNQTVKSLWSETFRFRTIAEEITNAPILIEPINGAKEQNPEELNFLWSKVDSVKSYDGSYNLQIATSDDFAINNIVLDKSDIFVENPVIYKLPELDTLYWRARGLNEVGPGPWSETRSFETFDPLGINDFVNLSALEMTPNPNNGNFRLDFFVKESGNIDVTVFDLLANKLFENNYGTMAIGNQSLDFKFDFQPGTYMLLIKNENSVVSYKFNIQK